MPTEIGLEEVQRLVAGGAQLVEVLPDREYAAAHLPGAISLPLVRLNAESAGALDFQRAIIVYCWDAL